jgi:hypothetical protein
MKTTSVLLNPKVALELVVARDGRRLDPVAFAGAGYFDAEPHELQKCERSHDIDICHESFPLLLDSGTAWRLAFQQAGALPRSPEAPVPR